MEIETLQTLSIICYIAAGVLFLLGIALFFVLDIKRVVGILSGSTARKAIEEIKRKNQSFGNSSMDEVNLARGQITDKISPSGRIHLQNSAFAMSMETQKLNTAQLFPTSNETTVLNVQNLASSASETTVLSQYNPASNGKTASELQVSFFIEAELGFVGSTEIIE